MAASLLARSFMLKKVLRYGKRIVELLMGGGNSHKSMAQRDYEFLKAHGVDTEYGYVTLLGEPIIQKAPNSTIKIGKGVLLISDSQYNSAGVNHPCIIATEKEGAEIVLEEGTGFSGVSIVARNRIYVGKRSGCGVNCNIWDTDFHSLDANKRASDENDDCTKNSPIEIGEDVWMGAGVTVLKGVTIGDNCIIGAMSLVNKDLPSNTMAAGAPVKVIKNIEPKSSEKNK